MSTHTTNAIVQTSKLVALGDAIRAKTGSSAEMTIDEMATAVASIPSGGSTKVFEGSFTCPDETNYVQTMTIPYTGTGYPIYFLFCVDGGDKGNATFDSLIQKGAMKNCFGIKQYFQNVPTYPTTNAYPDKNSFYTQSIGKSTDTSTSSGGTFTSSGTYICQNKTPSKGSSSYIRFTNSTTLKIFIDNTNSSSGDVHFAGGITYRYVVVYSS